MSHLDKSFEKFSKFIEELSDESLENYFKKADEFEFSGPSVSEYFSKFQTQYYTDIDSGEKYCSVPLTYFSNPLLDVSFSREGENSPHMSTYETSLITRVCDNGIDEFFKKFVAINSLNNKLESTKQYYSPDVNEFIVLDQPCTNLKAA